MTRTTPPPIGPENTPGHFAHHQWAEGEIQKSLETAGGTMTGPIVLPGNPASGLQAAPKQYVDASKAATETVYSATLALASGWSGVITLKRQGVIVTCQISALKKATTPATNETIATIPPGFKPTAYGLILTGNVSVGTGIMHFIYSSTAIVTFNPAPASTFTANGGVTWYTADTPPA